MPLQIIFETSICAANSETPDKMPHYAKVHLGLHCLSKSSLISHTYRFTHISLAFFCGAYANSTDPDQMPHKVASDQGLHWLLTEILLRTYATKYFPC